MTSKRRAKQTMPEPIPDTPDNIMHAIVNTPPKTADSTGGCS